VTGPSATETLPRKDQAAHAGACERCQLLDNVLLSTPSRIDYGPHRFREFGHSAGFRGKVFQRLKRSRHLAAGGGCGGGRGHPL
jgi:hypothetical protein